MNYVNHFLKVFKWESHTFLPNIVMVVTNHHKIQINNLKSFNKPFNVTV